MSIFDPLTYELCLSERRKAFDYLCNYRQIYNHHVQIVRHCVECSTAQPAAAEYIGLFKRLVANRPCLRDLPYLRRQSVVNNEFFWNMLETFMRDLSVDHAEHEAWEFAINNDLVQRGECIEVTPPYTPAALTEELALFSCDFDEAMYLLRNSQLCDCVAGNEIL